MKDSAVAKSIIPLHAVSIPSLSSLQGELDAAAGQCTHCNLRRLCLPSHMLSGDTRYLNKIVQMRRRLKYRQSLYRAGDGFKSLYVIHHGSFKTYLLTEEGREQVTGFHMPADLIGIDGLGTEVYTLHAVALEDSEVCVISYATLEKLAGQIPLLQHWFFKIMGAAIMRSQNFLLTLSGMHAEQRVAFFLLVLSQRFAALGYAPNEFQLRMKRDEIGSYLGLSIETVSRTFSKLHQKKLIKVHQKHMQIIDSVGLQRIADYF